LWIEEAEEEGYVCLADECMFDIKKEMKFSKTLDKMYKQYVDVQKG